MVRGFIRKPSPAWLKRAEAVDHAGDIGGDVAQVAAINAHCEVDRRLEVSMRDLRRNDVATKPGDVPQGNRFFLFRARDRDVEEGFDRVDLLFKVLDTDEVLVLADWVDPEVLLVKLDARIERRNHVFHDFCLVEPEVSHLGTIDFDNVFGIIETLENPGIDDSVDYGSFALHRLSDRARRARCSSRRTEC